MNIKDLRLAASPMTERVYVGRLNKEGNMFVGNKKDVTSDFLRVVVELYAGYELDIQDKHGNKYVLSVKKVEE